MTNGQMINGIDGIVANYPDRPSLFQLNFLMLGKEPTHQAKLWRCATELKTRRRSLEQAYMQLEELKDQIKLQELDRAEAYVVENKNRRDIKCRQFDRRIKQTRLQVQDMENTIKNIQEEATFFLQAYESLSRVEAPKNWESDAVQTEYWGQKYLNEINERLMLRLPIDADLFRTVMALPDGTVVKGQVLALVDSLKKVKAP